jgi:hypothetical protein
LHIKSIKLFFEEEYNKKCEEIKGRQKLMFKESSALKMEAVCSSKILVSTYKST